MAAAALSFQSVSPFPSSFPSNQQLKLRKPALSLIEIADKSTQFCSLGLSFSSITTDGNRRGSRRTKIFVSGKKNGDESKKSFDGNTAPDTTAQDDILALFRRIRSSDFKGEILSSKSKSLKSKSLSSSKNKSTAESVLHVLRESRPSSSKDKSTAESVLHVLRESRPSSSKVKSTAESLLDVFRESRPSSSKDKSTAESVSRPSSSKDKSTAESVLDVLRDSRTSSSVLRDSRTSSSKHKSTAESVLDVLRDTSLSKDKSTAESVLDVLRESRTTVRATRSRNGGKAWRRKANVPKVTQRRTEKVDAATMGFKLLRPPAKFVKRSPIPFPRSPRPRGRVLEQKNEVAATDDEDEGSKLAKIEKLKLAELKELAKAKGIKGYSRLKKSELVQLLRS